MIKKLSLLLTLPVLLCLKPIDTENNAPLLFADDFNDLHSGDMFSSVGAHTEYHYLKEAAPKGNWALSTFRYGTQNSWSVQSDGNDKVILQKRRYEVTYETHPMIVTGDELWKDYSVEARFAPLEKPFLSGVVFRYRNDRCYYFFGVEQNKAILKMVNHGKGFRIANEKILAEAPFDYKEGAYLTAHISVKNNSITARFENGPSLTATDATFPKGKIALTADVPTKFSYVKVYMEEPARKLFEKEKATKLDEEKKLQAANPKLKLWKKINTKDFGVGRNLRFGDLNGDGALDVLIGQVIHHGRADSNSELSCLTAMTFDGERLWQIGTPDPWKDHLTNDGAFQIHDIDNDGKNEVIYTMNLEIIVADAATGKTKYKAPTPILPGTFGNVQPNMFPKILGDCIYFCDLEGKGYDSNIIIKDRYKNLWALNSKLELLWTYACNTGHYPFAYDVDKDGKDELMIGYTLFAPDGKVLWTLQDQIQDHADGVAIVDFKNNSELRLLCAASDEGMFFTDTKGKMIKHHYIGHAQNPAALNLRDDLPGLETISIDFWGNQGIVHMYDSDFNIYHDFEPNQYGSMILPLNWTGRTEEFWVHNANVDEGGIYDGWGRKVVVFPDDGHPDMCNAVMDLTGDARDEIVVWNPEELWIYTQDDNPKKGKLYKPKRNPLYNYSNYQATVSLPGWSE